MPKHHEDNPLEDLIEGLTDMAAGNGDDPVDKDLQEKIKKAGDDIPVGQEGLRNIRERTGRGGKKAGEKKGGGKRGGKDKGGKKK